MPLHDNGGSTLTHALLPSSPLIDILPDCANLNDDQRGVPRPRGAKCDPGAYEMDPEKPPEYFDDLEEGYQPLSLESDDCDPFAGMEVSVMTLSLPEDTMALPVVLRADHDIPGLNPETLNGSPLSEYRAVLGDNVAYQCGLQGFPDRLYCMFKLTTSTPGLALDFKLYLNDCADPVFVQPLLSVPEPSSRDKTDDPGLACTADLRTPDCEATGGHISPGTTTAPECVCP